jgi:cytochrome c biogenesis protein CcdA
VLGLLAWTWHGGDWVRAAAWAGFGLLLATAWLLPWYLVWALPLAAVSRDRALQLLVLALTAYQLGARIPL